MDRASRVAAMAALLLCLPGGAAESTAAQIGESPSPAGPELVQADLRDPRCRLTTRTQPARSRTAACPTPSCATN